MREAAKVLAGQGLTYTLQLTLVLVAARMLGPDGQGDLAILRTSVYLGESFLWLGLTSSLTYLVAKDESKYHDPLLRVSLTYLVLAIVGVAVGLQLFSFHHKQHGTLTTVVDNRAIFVTWLAALALLQLFQKTLLGQRRFTVYNRVCIISAASAIILLFILGASEGFSVVSVAQASILASLIALAYALWEQRARLGRLRWPTSELVPVVRDAYGIGLKGYISTIAFLVLYRLDFFFVAHFLGSGALGVYAVAVFVIEAVQKVPDWLAMMLAPQVANDRDPDGHLTRRYAASALAVVGLFAFIIVVLSRWEGALFRIALGEGYGGVEKVVVFLLPRALLHAVMVTYAGHLAGRGYTIYHPLAGLTGVCVLCVVDLLAISRYKLYGAVAGITIAYLAVTTVMLLGYREQRRAGLRSTSPVRPGEYQW